MFVSNEFNELGIDVMYLEYSFLPIANAFDQ